MIGKHIGSLEGRAAEIEYDKLSHSYKEEEYGKHIAELILKQSYGIEDYSEQIPSECIIWQDNKYALSFDEYECIFDLFQISDNTNESVKASAKLIRLTESDLHRIIKESVMEVINEIGNTDKYYGNIGYTMGYHDAMRSHGGTPEEREMGRKKADRAMSLSTRLQKHQNNGELYDIHSKESADQYRANTYASNDGYKLGWEAFMKEKGL